MSNLPTPTEILAHLDKNVHGQCASKRILAKAAYFHYLNLGLREEGSLKNPSPEHCLIVGPTGSGKTLLVKTLGELLDVPVLFANAAMLTSEGYIGESVGDLLARLAAFCRNKPGGLERAILFLDEIDKIGSFGGGQATIRTSMVQDELLAVLDGNRLTRSKQTTFTEYDVDTSKLLIIATGAFSGIDKIIQRRLGTALGFAARHDEASDPDATSIYRQVVAEDIVAFGFIPELVGRFSNLIPMDPLSEGDLVSILNSPTSSPLLSREKIFSFHGIELDFTEDAKREMARIAIEQKTGARALRSAIDTALRSVDWRITDLADQGVTHIRFTDSTIRRESEPELHVTGKADRFQVSALRARVLHKNADSPREGAAVSEIDAILKDSGRYEALRAELGFDFLTGAARKWWSAFELENRERRGLIVKLMLELQSRKATIADFFLAYVYGNTDNIQANLEYLDYTRLKRAEEEKKKLKGKTKDRPAPQIPLSEETRAFARAEMRFSEATELGRCMWEIVEYRLSTKESELLLLVESLRKVGIRSAEELANMAALADTIDPNALVAYSRALRERIAQSQDPLAPAILEALVKGRHRDLRRKVSAVRALHLVARGSLWPALHDASAEIHARYSGADAEASSDLDLTDYLTDKELSERLQAALELCCDAIAGYPGEPKTDRFVSWGVKQLEPLLHQLVVRDEPCDLNAIVKRLQKVIRRPAAEEPRIIRSVLRSFSDHEAIVRHPRFTEILERLEREFPSAERVWIELTTDAC